MAGHWGQLANCQMASIDRSTRRVIGLRAIDFFSPSFWFKDGIKTNRQEEEMREDGRDHPSIMADGPCVSSYSYRTFWPFVWVLHRETTTDWNSILSPESRTGENTQGIWKKSWPLTEKKRGKENASWIPIPYYACLQSLSLTVCELYIFKKLGWHH